MSEPAGPHVKVAASVLGKLEAYAFAAHQLGCADTPPERVAANPAQSTGQGGADHRGPQGARRRTLAGRGQHDEATVMGAGLGGRPATARCW